MIFGDDMVTGAVARHTPARIRDNGRPSELVAAGIGPQGGVEAGFAAAPDDASTRQFSPSIHRNPTATEFDSAWLNGCNCTRSIRSGAF
jgi:hypothetical protein